MSSHRMIECLIILLVATLLGGCAPQRPVEETAVATHIVGPRPERTPTTTPAPTNTPLPMPAATVVPAYTATATATPVPMTPTPPPSPTPWFPALPTSPSPATPLPPVPVFAGLLRHDLQLHLDGTNSTLSYLTDISSPTHLDALRELVAANWGDTRVLEERPRMQFSSNRQLMAFQIEHPPPEDGAGRGAPAPNIVVLNESGVLIGDTFTGHFQDWLGGEGVITGFYDSVSSYFFDGRPPLYLNDHTNVQLLGASSDEDTIVYAARPWGGETELWRMDWDGSNPSLIFTTSDESIRYPTLSPDGTQLAFLMSGRIQVLELSSGEINSFDANGTPVWSPDSQRLAVYTQSMTYNNQDVIYLIDLMNGRTRKLWVTIPPEGIFEGQKNSITDVTWSPDGEWLAFLLQHNSFVTHDLPTEDIWLTDLDRTTLIRLTDDGVRKDELRWWP